MSTFFNFNALPVELALEIIGLAASPEIESQRSQRPFYETALALGSVSYNFRQATMPHLLHSVILFSDSQLKSFIHSIHMQRGLNRNYSRLSLDYSSMVRRLWSAECWDSLVDEPFDDRIDYFAIYEVLAGLDSLGISQNAFALLYNALEYGNLPNAKPWTCQKVTFAGPFWRWKPLISTVEGLRFLSQISHLTFWIEDFPATAPKPRSPSPPYQVLHASNSLESVPFAYMPRLTHFSCLYREELNGATSTDSRNCAVIAWTTMPRCPFGPSSFAHLHLWPSLDLLQHGKIIPLPSSGLINDKSRNWELDFLQGASEYVWRKMEQIKRPRSYVP